MDTVKHRVLVPQFTEDAWLYDKQYTELFVYLSIFNISKAKPVWLILHFERLAGKAQIFFLHMKIFFTPKGGFIPAKEK